MELTNRQKEVLLAINQLATRNGYAPTLREVMEYLEYNSISAVQRHTDALKKKGYLSSDRQLKVENYFKNKPNIPLVGMVTCGEPILAVENIEAYIPYDVPGDPKDYFFLRAIGDSMNLAGIDDGDLVLIKKQFDAQNGDKVVALIGDEATIKVFKKSKDHVILEPKSSNPANKPIYVLDDIQIQGKVVDKIRFN
ncbi:MAG: transcriptional repressor LexA [bacterium]|nr:transcriptional repressor LexA [bacterium]